MCDSDQTILVIDSDYETNHQVEKLCKELHLSTRELLLLLLRQFDQHRMSFDQIGQVQFMPLDFPNRFSEVNLFSCLWDKIINLFRTRPLRTVRIFLPFDVYRRLNFIRDVFDGGTLSQTVEILVNDHIDEIGSVYDGDYDDGDEIPTVT